MSAPVRILGLDPGLQHTGWGVIECGRDGRLSFEEIAGLQRRAFGALEAHGEIVPKRGVTKNKFKPSRALGVCSTLCAANKACSFSTVAASGAFSLPTKYQNSLFSFTSGRPSAAAFCKSFSTRKSERAVTPRKGKTTDMIQLSNAVGKGCIIRR